MDRTGTARAHDLIGFPEEVLVARARQHDEAAVREVVRRYNQRLFRTARSVMRNDLVVVVVV